jgi:hypothetical protein
MNNFQIDMAFKNYTNDVWYLKLAFTSKVMKIHKMEYMVSLPTVDFISIYLLDNGPLYWITLWGWSTEIWICCRIGGTECL